MLGDLAGCGVWEPIAYPDGFRRLNQDVEVFEHSINANSLSNRPVIIAGQFTNEGYIPHGHPIKIPEQPKLSVAVCRHKPQASYLEVRR